MIFIGSPHAWYCDDCKQKTLSEQRQKDIQRIKQKKCEQTCVVCGKKFLNYKKKQTCGTDCESKLRSMARTGKGTSEPTKEKIADQNCIKWHLVSPEGKHYKFYNLKEWARNNCELFGFPQNSKNADKIAAGISQAKGAVLGTNSCPVTTYKGWRVMIEYGPSEICKLYKNGWNINKIHNVSGISSSKIRKILITKDLWENELAKKVKIHLSQGKTEKEISELLGVSEKVVNDYAPYSKGVYNWKPSKNALYLKEYHKKEKNNDKK